MGSLANFIQIAN